MATWHILTTSYPPYRGGLGFHSCHLGECLAIRGHRVMVWSAFNPENKDTVRRWDAEKVKNVEHYRISNHWDQQSFAVVLKQIVEWGGSLVIQYRPQAFSSDSASSLVEFLKSLKAYQSLYQHTVKVGLMVHRVFEDFLVHSDHQTQSDQRLWNSMMQLKQISKLICLVDFVFVTSSLLAHRLRWHPFLMFKKSISVGVMPVSSPVSYRAGVIQVRNLKQAYCGAVGDDCFVVGTYSSFKEPEVLTVISAVMTQLLLKNRGWIWLGFGRYSTHYFQVLRAEHSHLCERIVSAGELDPEALSAHVLLCDVMFQPYYQGINTQRASAMVVLDHAKPLVTSSGRYTEKIWHSRSAVRLQSWNDQNGFQQTIEELSLSDQTRHQLGQRGKQLYDEMFSWKIKRGLLEQMSETLKT